jgi:transposase
MVGDIIADSRATSPGFRINTHREQERGWVEQAEAAYARFVAGWNASGPKARTGAAKEERQ